MICYLLLFIFKHWIWVIIVIITLWQLLSHITIHHLILYTKGLWTHELAFAESLSTKYVDQVEEEEVGEDHYYIAIIQLWIMNASDTFER